MATIAFNQSNYVILGRSVAQKAVTLPSYLTFELWEFVARDLRATRNRKILLKASRDHSLTWVFIQRHETNSEDI
jgi:hypothetical protein